MNFEKQTTDEFLLECIRQNHGLLRDTKMEEELEERIFQRKIENDFYGGLYETKYKYHKRGCYE